MTSKKFIIGTRGSALALWQAEHIKSRLKAELGVESDLKIVKTKGDKILDVPLAKIGGKGLFTKELEELLLSGEIDLAVHSLKDVPVELPSGLTLASITKREDVRDCLLSYKYESLDSLPQGAKVGTTSLRRTMQILAKRPDLEALSLRGNVQTRLKKLESGEFHAIMLAAAGLKRLGITNEQIPHITDFEVDEMIPAMGQAALGIECRNDEEITSLLEKLSDKEAMICASAEREFIRALDGGCQVPIGVHCKIVSDSHKADFLNINAIVGIPSGEKILRESLEISIKEIPQKCSQKSLLDLQKTANDMAKNLADKMIAQGAKEILQEALSFWE